MSADPSPHDEIEIDAIRKRRAVELAKCCDRPSASGPCIACGQSSIMHDLKAILAALSRAAAPQWRSIESAPKDGTRVLVYACAHKRHWFGTGYYFKGVPGDGEGWIAHSFYTTPKDDCSGSFEPTHWQPMLTLPEAPQ